MTAKFMLAAPVVIALSALVSAEKPTYLLHNGRTPGQTDRVTVLVEVGGDITEVSDGKVRGEKMSVVCNLDYDEKTLETTADASGGSRSVRYYNEATAVVKVGQDQFKPALRPGRRMIGVNIDSQAMTLFSPSGTLTRDELELLDVLGNSLLLDRLLPEEPVAVGQRWKHSEKLMAMLLGLDEVGTTDVHSVLGSVTAADARIEMSGRVEGAIHGVSTKIELKAKYRFDRKRRRIDWLGLLVQEQRNSSPVTDGVDAVARVQVQILPKKGPTELTDANLKDLSLRPNAELRQLTYESAGGDWQFAYDRCWNVYRDQRDLVVLRMLDRGELIAQCNVSPLRTDTSGKQIALAEFQEDVRKALGESFQEYVEASQRRSDADYRIYRVSVRGKVSELPIQWNYYLVVDEMGHQVVFAFTVESGVVDRLHEADQRLVNSLRFVEVQMAMNAEQ